MSDTETQRESRLRRALLHRIHRRFQTVTQNIQIGELNFTFTRIADPDRVLDEVAAEEDRREKLRGTRTPGDELHLPYWAEFWDSALGIAQHLTSDATWCNAMQHLRILDLGSGMGFAGTVAAQLGANVVFADLEPAALLFARLNTLLHRNRVRTRQLNWRTDRLDESFDLIIGADILYERAQWEHLEPFWRSHLAPNGSVLLGEPGRQTGDLFIPWIQERRWSLQQSQQKVPTRDVPIRIFSIRPTTTKPSH
jgi:predicted nicotinamide N-methyase